MILPSDYAPKRGTVEGVRAAVTFAALEATAGGDYLGLLSDIRHVVMHAAGDACPIGIDYDARVSRDTPGVITVRLVLLGGVREEITFDVPEPR